MSSELPQDKVPLADKLDALEIADPPSLAWHLEVLEERRTLTEQGTLRFLDWDVAIAELRNEIAMANKSSSL